jgi:flagellar FliL protein
MPDVKEHAPVSEPPSAPKKSLIPANLAAMLTKVAIFGMIGLVAVFGAYLLTTKMLKPMLAHTPTTGQPVVEEPKKEPPHAETEKKAEEKSGGEGEGEGEGEGAKGGGVEGNFYTIESIVVNPAGTAGTRFLSCGVSFELENSADLKALEAKGVQIKDILITILSSKTVDELSDITQRNKMRRQILFVVNRFAAPTKAKAVYLTDFVLQ